MRDDDLGHSLAQTAAKGKVDESFFLNHIIIYLFKFTEVKDHN